MFSVDCCRLHFAFFSSLSCCFLTKIHPQFFFTHNTLERTAQTQFAYRGPEGTVTLLRIFDKSTNYMLTGWNAERGLQFSRGCLSAPHLQFHRRLLTFKDISAPLIFDQAVYIIQCAYACEYVVSALYKLVYWQVWQVRVCHNFFELDLCHFKLKDIWRKYHKMWIMRSWDRHVLKTSVTYALSSVYCTDP